MLFIIIFNCPHVKEEWDEMNEDVELPGCQRVCHHTLFYSIFIHFLSFNKGNIECDTPKQHSMASGM